jgi:hypothetical protein
VLSRRVPRMAVTGSQACPVVMMAYSCRKIAAADRTVIEVEVEGERQVCVGIHQAIKYRSLAVADAGYPLLTSRVRSLVVACSTDYAKARDLAHRYDIPLISVNREKVLDRAR